MYAQKMLLFSLGSTLDCINEMPIIYAVQKDLFDLPVYSNNNSTAHSK